MTDNFTPVYAENFVCEKCDFKCFKNSDWNRHILTRKHNDTYKSSENSLTEQHPDFTCNCGKVYKHRQSLFNHTKKMQNKR